MDRGSEGCEQLNKKLSSVSASWDPRAGSVRAPLGGPGGRSSTQHTGEKGPPGAADAHRRLHGKERRPEVAAEGKQDKEVMGYARLHPGGRQGSDPQVSCVLGALQAIT